MQWKFTPSVLLAGFVCFCYSVLTQAQVTDTLPTSIDPALLEISTSKVPKEYTIAGIKVTGTKHLDEQLLDFYFGY